jgi:hypothetical protein
MNVEIKNDIDNKLAEMRVARENSIFAIRDRIINAKNDR